MTSCPVVVRRAAARCLFLASLLLPGPSPADPVPLLVAVGDVTPTTAVVWARRAEPGEISVDTEPMGGQEGVRARFSVTAETDLTGKAALTGLRPRTRYRYTVRAATAEVAGEFVTAPAPDDPAPVRLVWSGDLGSVGACRRVGGGYGIFRAIADRRPDVFLFVGDTIYADHRCRGPRFVEGGDFVATTLPAYRAKHRYNREDPAFQALLRLTSVDAIWDDHEVRNDFAGTVDPLMPIGRRAFLEYWPILPPREEPGRLYRKFRWGRAVEIFILDTRQYRTPNAEPDGPGKTMLGRTQRAWLVDEVAASTATWKVVVSSVPLSVPTGGGVRDSWSNASVWGVPEEGKGFATERDRILGELHARGVRNLVVLAADVHHAEVIRHEPAPGFAVHEFIAGPLSASPGRPRPLDAALNPRTLFARGGVDNFGELAVDARTLTVRIVGEDGGVLFAHTVPAE